MNQIPVPESTIEAFADKHGLVMEARERGSRVSPNSRWYAHFENVEVKDGNCLVGSFGNGSTPNEAIQEYSQVISEKIIVVSAYTNKRREIIVPRLAAK